ncbi:Protein of unknown function [Bacillus toyonensis]|nr:Protein of unknown function [Bacillus toyonensis]
MSTSDTIITHVMLYISR